MPKKSSLQIKTALQIRSLYHDLEKEHHKTEWSLEEDALAFLSDAGLVGRLVMSHEKRWPLEKTAPQLRHKIAECMWWLIVISDRAGLDAEDILSEFLAKTLKKIKDK